MIDDGWMICHDESPGRVNERATIIRYTLLYMCLLCVFVCAFVCVRVCVSHSCVPADLHALSGAVSLAEMHATTGSSPLLPLLWALYVLCRVVSCCIVCAVEIGRGLCCVAFGCGATVHEVRWFEWLTPINIERHG